MLELKIYVIFPQGTLTFLGPATWCKDFPVANGTRQSPIDIVTTKCQYDSNVQGANPLTTNYTPENELHLVNNGHSVLCQIKEHSGKDF